MTPPRGALEKIDGQATALFPRATTSMGSLNDKIRQVQAHHLMAQSTKQNSVNFFPLYV